jgi:hypothetical protein
MKIVKMIPALVVALALMSAPVVKAEEAKKDAAPAAHVEKADAKTEVKADADKKECANCKKGKECKDCKKGKDCKDCKNMKKKSCSHCEEEKTKDHHEEHGHAKHPADSHEEAPKTEEAHH